MPWNLVTQMEEIIRFVMLARSDRFTLTELCEQFGVSRKTAYKHLARYEADGLKGLQVRSGVIAIVVEVVGAVLGLGLVQPEQPDPQVVVVAAA